MNADAVRRRRPFLSFLLFKHPKNLAFLYKRFLGTVPGFFLYKDASRGTFSRWAPGSWQEGRLHALQGGRPAQGATAGRLFYAVLGCPGVQHGSQS